MLIILELIEFTLGIGVNIAGSMHFCSPFTLARRKD